MKFLIHVAPSLAIRANNERFGEQYVDVPIDQFTDDEREVIADSAVDLRTCAVDLSRTSVGLPASIDAKMAKADEAAVRELLSARLEPIITKRQAGAAVGEHFEAMLASAIAEVVLHERAANLSNATVKCAADWLVSERAIPPDLGVPVAKALLRYPRAASLSITVGLVDVDLLRPSQKQKKGSFKLSDALHWDDFSRRLRYSKTIHEAFGPDAPDYGLTLQEFSHAFSRWIKEPGHAEVFFGMLDRQTMKFASELRAQLAAVDPRAIDTALHEVLDEELAGAFEAAFFDNILRNADARSPDLRVRDRADAGVLPDAELRDVLRQALFAHLDEYPRYKRIDISDLPAKRRANVKFDTVPAETVSAKTFSLAEKLRKSVPPEGNVSVVTHRAIEGNKVLDERQVVRVSLSFRGHALSREYVAT